MSGCRPRPRRPPRRRRTGGRPSQTHGRARRRAKAVHRGRSHDLRAANRHGAASGDVASDRRAVPHAHRALRGPSQRDHHRLPRRSPRGRGARPGAGAGQAQRATPRDSRRPEGQHPHHEHVHDGRRPRVRRLRPALRSDPDPEPAGGRRRHPGQDGHDRARQLGGRRHARELQRPQGLRHEPVRSPARPPRSDVRRPPGALPRRIELGHRDRGELLGRERGHGNLGLDPEPRQPEHAGRGQADGGSHQPLRRHSHHRGPGHRGSHGAHGHGRRHPSRRARRRRARPQRRVDPWLPAAARARLHALPQSQRATGCAHRHPSRQLLRQGDAPGSDGAARRAERGPG